MEWFKNPNFTFSKPFVSKLQVIAYLENYTVSHLKNRVNNILKCSLKTDSTTIFFINRIKWKRCWFMYHDYQYQVSKQKPTSYFQMQTFKTCLKKYLNNYSIRSNQINGKSGKLTEERYHKYTFTVKKHRGEKNHIWINNDYYMKVY